MNRDPFALPTCGYGYAPPLSARDYPQPRWLDIYNYEWSERNREIIREMDEASEERDVYDCE